MNQGFNLIDSPWIPCVTPEGAVSPQGILAALGEARRFTEIRDASPLVTVALHRLLLAILHRVFGPETPDAWEELWKAGRFDAAILGGYLKSTRVYPRFNLFDPKHPFYQTG